MPERPPLTGRIHYLIGGQLPPSARDWVVADLTGPGWRHRQARRPLLLMLPFAVAFAILPASPSVRVSIPLALLVCAIAMGYATSDTFRNRRLDQYGIPRPKPVEEDEDEDFEPPAPTRPAPDGNEDEDED
ncbi:MAG TPA: DUF5313 family protein [Frankiaceae bacterium]|nr:DUF5313 family protein [Frankiaceae bacterium]